MPALEAQDTKIVEAEYSVPFVTHACMESMNATAILRDDKNRRGLGTFSEPMTMQAAVGRGMGWAGISPRDVLLHITMNGGAFDAEVIKMSSPKLLFWLRVIQPRS